MGDRKGKEGDGMQWPRKMDGRKERRRGYGKRDSSPLDGPAGQTPVTAVHWCSDIAALQHYSAHSYNAVWCALSVGGVFRSLVWSVVYIRILSYWIVNFCIVVRGHNLCSVTGTELQYLHFYVTFGAKPAGQHHSFTVLESATMNYHLVVQVWCLCHLSLKACLCPWARCFYSVPLCLINICLYNHFICECSDL